jgi:hypothetical protein
MKTKRTGNGKNKTKTKTKTKNRGEIQGSFDCVTHKVP